MPEIVEQTTRTTTRWYSSILTPQNVVLLISLFVSATFFVFRMNMVAKNINDKADEKEIVLLKEQIKALEEKVNRQYGTAKDDRDKENAAIEEVADWMHEERGRQAGYKQAMEEKKK
jgi:hypothetical protein